MKSIRILVQEYLLRNTPKTLTPIVDGVEGELSKVSEEYHELVDAYAQNLRALSFIEGCDVVDATMKLQFRQFGTPSLVVLVVVYLRRLYKPIRNRIYEFAGLGKEDFNS